jgi:hypothetical protein
MHIIFWIQNCMHKHIRIYLLIMTRNNHICDDQTLNIGL